MTHKIKYNIRMSGAFKRDTAHNYIPQIVSVRSLNEGRQEGTKLQAGDTVIVTLNELDISREARIDLVYNPSLYENGTLTGPTTITEMNQGFISFRFETDVDIDLNDYEWLVKLVYDKSRR